MLEEAKPKCSTPNTATTAESLETSKAGLEQVLDKFAESLKGQ
jgi:hypothetical protein